MVAVLLVFSAALRAADRAIGWLRPGPGAIERELNEQARRGLRLAAVSDGLPACAVVVMQAPEPAGPPASYRVVPDRRVIAELEGLVAEGFVPRASWRGLGLRHDVVFERAGPAAAGAWRAVEFESLERLADALASTANEGFRPRLLVRPAFRSWPGLSERGILLVHRAPDAAAAELRVLQASRRNVDDLAREVAGATAAGWQFDVLFAQTRDGNATGRRERAVVLLSKSSAPAAAARPVTVERRSSFGILGDRIVGAAAYWDEMLVASVDDDRRQAWATPVALGDDAARCMPLGLGFRVDAPRDLSWTITGLVAVPAVAGGGQRLFVLTDQPLGVR